MELAEKTVFLSYRRTNAPWALAIYQNFKHNGYDVFFDYNGVASGDFEQVILGNIKARAHFIVLLTPSALERCHEPGDWLCREIETALEAKRNVVSLMLEGFNFDAPGIAGQLKGKLEGLRKYNALEVPVAFFEEAMERLRSRYLNVPLSAVLHPSTPFAQQVASEQKHAADAAPPVQEKELSAQQWFELGVAATDHDEEIRFNTEAIRLEPDFPEAFYNRGNAHYAKGDFDGALKDYDEAIRLKPDHASAFNNRGSVRFEKGDFDGALKDYDEAIRLQPDYASAFYNRAKVFENGSDSKAAAADFQRYLDCGGGFQNGDQSAVEERIRNLRKKF